MKRKIIVEHNEDGYTAYPAGHKGVVVGQGETYEKAIEDVKSAIRAHIEVFGAEVAKIDPKAEAGEADRFGTGEAPWAKY